MPKKKRRIPDHVRVSAKALIIVDSSLLVIRKRDVFESKKNATLGDEYLVLPGGGQDLGEPLDATVRRECLEEIGIRVLPRDIAFARDYIGANHEFSKKHRKFHQLEVVFSCDLDDGTKGLGSGTEEDPGQINIEWIRLSDILELPFYPKELRSSIVEYANSRQHRIYLGDIN